MHYSINIFVKLLDTLLMVVATVPGRCPLSPSPVRSQGHSCTCRTGSPRERQPPVGRDHGRRLRESTRKAIERRVDGIRSAEPLVKLLEQARHQAALRGGSPAPRLAAVIGAQLHPSLGQLPAVHQQHCHVAPFDGVLLPKLRAEAQDSQGKDCESEAGPCRGRCFRGNALGFAAVSATAY